MEQNKKAVIIHYIYGINEGIIAGPFSVKGAANILGEYGIKVDLSNADEKNSFTSLLKSLLNEFNAAKKSDNVKQEVYNLLFEKYPMPEKFIKQDKEFTKNLKAKQSSLKQEIDSDSELELAPTKTPKKRLTKAEREALKKEASLIDPSIAKKGQLYKEIPKGQALRDFYDSLYVKNPEDKDAKKWLIEHGSLPSEKELARAREIEARKPVYQGGQKYETPAPGTASRVFYERMYVENASPIAERWLIERGLPLPTEDDLDLSIDDEKDDNVINFDDDDQVKDTKKENKIRIRTTETVDELDPLRMYYESLYKENPNSQMAKKWLLEHNVPLPSEKDIQEFKEIGYQQPTYEFEEKKQKVSKQTTKEEETTVNAPSSVNVVDKLYFFNKSKDVPAGQGANEYVEDAEEYSSLNLIKNWRQHLSNQDECKFKWKNPFTNETFTYNSVEHAYQASKYLSVRMKDIAYKFTLESKDPISEDDAQKYRQLVSLDSKQQSKWNMVKKEILESISRSKFEACKTSKRALLLTRNAELWHIVPRQRAQRFDHLEKLREELRASIDSESESESELEVVSEDSGSELEMAPSSSSESELEIIEEKVTLSEEAQQQAKENEEIKDLEEDLNLKRELLKDFDLKEAVFSVLDSHPNVDWTVSKLKKQIIEDFYLPQDALAGTKMEISEYYASFQKRSQLVNKMKEQMLENLKQKDVIITEDIIRDVNYNAIRMYEEMESKEEKKIEEQMINKIEQLQEKELSEMKDVQVIIMEPTAGELKTAAEEVIKVLLLSRQLNKITLKIVKSLLEEKLKQSLSTRKDELKQIIAQIVANLAVTSNSEEEEKIVNEMIEEEYFPQIEDDILQEISESVTKSLKKKETTSGKKVVKKPLGAIVSKVSKKEKTITTKMTQANKELLEQKNALRLKIFQLSGEIVSLRGEISILKDNLYSRNKDYITEFDIDVEYDLAVRQMKDQKVFVPNPKIQEQIENKVNQINEKKEQIDKLEKQLEELGPVIVDEEDVQKYSILKEIKALEDENKRLNDTFVPTQWDEKTGFAVDEKLYNQVRENRIKIDVLKRELYGVEDKKSLLQQVLGTSRGGKKEDLKLEEYRITHAMTNMNRVNLPYLAFLSYYSISYLIPIEDPTLEQTFKLFPRMDRFKRNFASLSVKQRYEFCELILSQIDLKSAVENIASSDFLHHSIFDLMMEFMSSVNCDITPDNVDQKSLSQTITIYVKHRDKVTAKNLIEEFNLNTRFYVRGTTSPDPEKIADDIIRRVYRNCPLPDSINGDKARLMEEIKKMLKNAVTSTDVATNAHSHQYNELKKYYDGLILSKIDPEDQFLVQRLFEKIFPKRMTVNQSISYMISRLQETIPIKMYIKGEVGQQLDSLIHVFNKKSNRKLIYDIKETVEQAIGNKKLTPEQKKEAEINSVKASISAGLVNKIIGQFLLDFIDLYGSVSELPRQKFKQNNMFKFKNITDLPESLREEAYNNLRPIFERMERDKVEREENRRLKAAALSKLQTELNNPEVDKMKIIQYINELGAREEEQTRLLYLIQKGEWHNIYLMLRQIGTEYENRIKVLDLSQDQKRQLDGLFKNNNFRGIFNFLRSLGKEKAAEVLEGLLVEDSLAVEILKLVEQGGNWDIIKDVLNKLRPSQSVTLKNPLIYQGIRRAQRLAKLPKFVSEIEQLRRSYPMMSKPLKELMETYYFHPWTPSSITKEFRYFIADAKFREKVDLPLKDQLMFGARLFITDEDGNALNYYVPTTLFWKVFCSNYFTSQMGHFKCNTDTIVSAMTIQGGDEQRFVFGMYKINKPQLEKKKQENPLEKPKTSWADMVDEEPVYPEDAPRQGYIIVHQEIINDKLTTKVESQSIDHSKGTIQVITFGVNDFKKQCEWFEQEYNSEFTEYQIVSRSDMVRERKVREKARFIGLKNIIDALQKINNKEIFLKLRSQNISHLDRIAQMIETSIYKLTKDASGQRKPLFQYFKMVSDFLFYFDELSPAFNYVEYYRTLILTAPMTDESYQRLISMDITQKFPEIYLIPNKDTFITSIMLYIESTAKTFIEELVSDMFGNIARKSTIADFEKSKLGMDRQFRQARLGLSEVNRYLGLCVNKDVRDPYFISKVENGKEELHYCVSRDQIVQILDEKFNQYSLTREGIDKLEVLLSQHQVFHSEPLDEQVVWTIRQIQNGQLELIERLPEEYRSAVAEIVKSTQQEVLPIEVINDVRLYFGEETEEKNLFRRLAKIRQEIKNILRTDKNLAFYLQVKDTRDATGDIIQSAYMIIEFIQDYLQSPLSEQEKEMVIEYTLSEANKMYLNIVQKLAEDYYNKNKDFFDAELTTELNIRKKKYGQNNEQMIMDREDRMKLFDGLFYYISQEYSYLPEYVKEGIVDYISRILFKPVETRENKLIYGVDKCFVCNQYHQGKYIPVETNVKIGQAQTPAEVRICSQECKLEMGKMYEKVNVVNDIKNLISSLFSESQLEQQLIQNDIQFKDKSVSYLDKYGALLLKQDYVLPMEIEEVIDNKRVLEQQSLTILSGIARNIGIDTTDLDIYQLFNELSKRVEVDVADDLRRKYITPVENEVKRKVVKKILDTPKKRNILERLQIEFNVGGETPTEIYYNLRQSSEFEELYTQIISDLISRDQLTLIDEESNEYEVQIRSNKCHVCQKEDTEGLYKTYAIIETVPVELKMCSRECFNKFEEEKYYPSKDQLEQITVENAIRRLIYPFMSYDQIISKLYELKVSEEDVKGFSLSYDSIYATLLSRKDYILPQEILEDRLDALDRLCEEFGVKEKSVEGKFTSLRDNEKFEQMWQAQINLILHPIVIARKHKEEFADECQGIDKKDAEDWIKKHASQFAYRTEEFDFNKDLFKVFVEKFKQCKRLASSITELTRGKRIQYAITELAAIMDIITTNKLPKVKEFYIQRHIQNEKNKMIRKFRGLEEKGSKSSLKKSEEKEVQGVDKYFNLVKLEKQKLRQLFNDEEKEMLTKIDELQGMKKEDRDAYTSFLTGEKKEMYDKVLKKKMEFETDMLDRIIKEKMEKSDPFTKIMNRVDMMDRYNKIKLQGTTVEQKVQTLLYELDSLTGNSIEKFLKVAAKHQFNMTTSEIGVLNYKNLLQKVGKIFINSLLQKLEDDFTGLEGGTVNTNGGPRSGQKGKKRVSPVRKLEIIKEERIERLKKVNESLKAFETEQLLQEKSKIDQYLKTLDEQIAQEKQREMEKKRPTPSPIAAKKSSRGIVGMKGKAKVEPETEIVPTVMLQKEMMTIRVRADIKEKLEKKLETTLDKMFPMLISKEKKAERRMEREEEEEKERELQVESDEELHLVEESDEELHLIQSEDELQEQEATQEDRDYSFLELESDAEPERRDESGDEDEKEQYYYEDADENIDPEEQEYDYGAEDADDDYNI